MKLHPVPPLTTQLTWHRHVRGWVGTTGSTTLDPRAGFSETAKTSFLSMLFGLFFYVNLVDNRLFLLK